MANANEQAYAAIMDRFADWADGKAEPLDLEEATRIASAHGAYPPDTVAEEASREAMLIYLGVGWGVGPKARWRDRLRAWWSCKWDSLVARDRS